MEMIFCFCQKCLDEIDRLCREDDSHPDYLNAYSDPFCSNCGKQLKMAGTRKFEVEMLNVQEQDGVHQYTEYAVLRFIAEPSENYLLLISCSQRKLTTPEPLAAIDRYDGVIQHGSRFFALFIPVREVFKIDGVEKIVDAHNFYVFSENGICWLEMIHVDKSYVLNQLGDGFFRTRLVIVIDAPMPAYRDPIVASDQWIQGSADRGFALEIIREALGLDFQCLTDLIGKESLS